MLCVFCKGDTTNVVVTLFFHMCNIFDFLVKITYNEMVYKSALYYEKDPQKTFWS